MSQVCWWWVRHGPTSHREGRFPERDAATLEPSPTVLARLAASLPPRPLWLASPLARSRGTAEALMRAVGTDDGELQLEPNLAEQDFGAWHGRLYEDVYRETGDTAWSDPATLTPPDGESFVDFVRRVTRAIEDTSLRRQAGDVVAIAHVGTVRAALAHALDLAPSRALFIEIAPLSLTRIDWLAGMPPAPTVRFVNRLSGATC